jgi:uncharacterized CHY-type Zn-finger protein
MFEKLLHKLTEIRMQEDVFEPATPEDLAQRKLLKKASVKALVCPHCKKSMTTIMMSVSSHNEFTWTWDDGEYTEEMSSNMPDQGDIVIVCGECDREIDVGGNSDMNDITQEDLNEYNE